MRRTNRAARLGRISGALAALAFVIGGAAAHSNVAAETVRIGVLKYGTVNWELDVIRHNGFDEAEGVTLEVTHFAGEAATAVALRAGDVDIVVTDWLETSRARSTGDDLTIAPYSTSVGAIMAPPGSPIQTIADLKGKRIGVAGGPLDKSWLLIQGLAQRDHGIDLAAENDVVFGAPPLLAEKARQGEVDAVLNFWHFCARLEADGFARVVGGGDAAAALGAKGPVSAIGYVFHEGWARDHPEAIAGFLAASRRAKQLLVDSDKEWERLHESGLIKDAGPALIALRDRFREGVPTRSVDAEEADAKMLFALLAQLGGEDLVGDATELSEGTFWRPERK